MGYDLHITRKRDWASPEGPEITSDEWLALVQSDPEFTLDPRNGPCFAIWSGPGAYACWIDYHHGNLFSKYPTDEFIEKMIALARQLGGKVQGDEGEVYPRGGQPPDEEVLCQ